MNFETDQEGERRRRAEGKSDQGNDNKVRASGKGTKPPKIEVGLALRSVYQQTVDESIPPEMLDLLGKLG